MSTSPARAVYRARRLPLTVAAVVVVVVLLAVPGIVANRFSDRVGTLASRTALLVLAALVLAVILARLGSPFPRRIVLELDLTQPLPEDTGNDPLGALTAVRKNTVRDVVEGLERAATDKRVAALLCRIATQPPGLARVQELRDAVGRFRESGKPAVAFAATFGEFTRGDSAYYLATACDEIVLQPSGDVGLVGIWGEATFLRGTFDKVGVEVIGDHRYEYKNAFNQFTERKFTPAHREAIEATVNSQFDQIVAGIAERRKMSEGAVRALVDVGPLLGAEAAEAGLVDRLAYRDEVVEDLKARAGKGGDLVGFGKWWRRRKRRARARGQTVALVYGVGAVSLGKSQYSPLTGGMSMGSDTVAGALRSAREDKRVKAIVFRVDSPGGSYVGSDVIWREVTKAKEAGKPVVVTMGNVAGSGGYFVAMHADRILAHPATITGSIGVLATKFVTTGLRDKVGLSSDEVHAGAHAGIFASTRGYSDDEWSRIQTWLDRIYDDFTGKVADGRKLDRETVHGMAKGRIWTGEDARERGLVDGVGGFPAALAATRELLDLKPDAPLKLRQFPKRKPFAQLKGAAAEGEAAAASVRAVAESLHPIAALATELGLVGTEGALAMPGWARLGS